MSHPLSRRINIIKAESKSKHTHKGQMQALQRTADQVTQTIRILEVFDEAWAALLMNLLRSPPTSKMSVFALKYLASRKSITERTLRLLRKSLV